MQPFHSLYYNILGYSSSPPKMAEQPPPLPPPINVHGGACTQSDVKEIAAPFPSFTALLAAAVAAEEEDFPPPTAPTTEQQIDHTITFHCDYLRNALVAALGPTAEAVEEAVAMKVKEKEMEIDKKLSETVELENSVEHFKAEARRLRERVEHLEPAVWSLRLELREARRRYAEEAVVVEDAESSFVDPDRVALVRLECKACRQRRATVMVWPCRHVCVCAVCEAVTTVCPVCWSVKSTSIVIRLPL